MNVVKALVCILFVVFAIPWLSHTGSSTSDPQQDLFRVYKVTSEWGYFGAAFSPDDRFVAVIASKGSVEGQETEVIKEVQVWDFRNDKLVSEKVLSKKRLPRPTGPYDERISLYGYTRSGSVLVLGRSGHLVLLDSKNLDEIREIDLGMSSWPKVDSRASAVSFVKEVATDRTGDRAVVLLQWGPGGGGELRVYDLNSANLIRRWGYDSLRKNDHYADFGGADIAPDGQWVAVSFIPFVLGQGALRFSDRNVYVLNVDTGTTVSTMNTGYPAGHLCFAPTDPLSLLTVSADNFDRKRSAKDAIKIWDPVSGRLLRELVKPGEGVHFQVQVSSDGDVVLGYTGLEKFRGRWWLGQEETGFIAYDEFTLWNLAKGNILASSAEIPAGESRRELLLSPRGDVVLLYPETAGGRTLTFFELRPTP
jgi:WD40 repeat protein